MTPERLAEIRRKLETEQDRPFHSYRIHGLTKVGRELLTYIDDLVILGNVVAADAQRLESENKLLRAVVAAAEGYQAAHWEHCIINSPNVAFCNCGWKEMGEALKAWKEHYG